MDEYRDNQTPPPGQPENFNPTPGTPEGAPPPPPPAAAPGPAGSPSKDARNMAMLAHLLGIFTSIIGPLIIWLMKKEDDPYIEQQSREALNFQITMLIAWAIAAITSIICIGAILAIIIPIVVLVLGIMAAVAVSDGKDYRYPFTLRLVK